MKRKTRVIGIALVGAILLPLAVYLSDDLNRAWWFPSGGSVDSGSVFGIEIGTQLIAAEGVLHRRGFRQVRIQHFRDDGRPRCLWKHHPEPGEELERWEAGSRRVVCIASLDERVTNVSWSFNPVEF
ncbi:MAG: hypothetical protein ABMA14_02840 [Hyphomonadaceae bacterium]